MCEPWPIVWPCDDLPEGATPEQRAAAESAAQQILWARTGRRLGLCTAHDLYRAAGGSGTCGRPYMSDDRVWHNVGAGGASSCAIDLVNTPVRSISEVKVFGEVVDPSSYRLEGNTLVRADICWPYVTSDQAPAIDVTYVWGVPLLPAPVIADPGSDPPVEAVAGAPLWGLAAAAMGEVAMELLKGMCGGECRLPSSAVSVTRMNVTVQMAAPAETAKVLLLGLEIADQLILTVNPARKQQRSRVYSPDMAMRS